MISESKLQMKSTNPEKIDSETDQQRLDKFLATTFVATINNILFFFFSPSSTFLIEGVLGSKNLFSKSYLERPKT